MLFLFCTTVYAQNIKVAYKQTFNYDLQGVSPLYLFVDAKLNKSVLLRDFTKEVTYAGDKPSVQTDFYVTLDRTIPYDYIYLDKANKKMDMYEDFASKVYKILDVFPEISWQLVNESKEINKIKVLKAVGKYRGKTWEVWYAPSIPYSFGPWKLNGLPGLILDAKETDGNIFYQAENIEYNVVCDICEPPTEKVLKEITLKDFLIIQDDFYNNIEADLPRGTTVKYEKKSILSTETEFEFPTKFRWEADY